MTAQPDPAKGRRAARIPVLPTLLVALAVLVMIGLGVWQLQRRGEKAQALA